MGIKQVKKGPLKEHLTATASATELVRITQEKSWEENCGGNSQSRKEDFEEVPCGAHTLKKEKKKKKKKSLTIPLPYPPSQIKPPYKFFLLHPMGF